MDVELEVELEGVVAQAVAPELLESDVQGYQVAFAVVDRPTIIIIIIRIIVIII